MAFNLAVGTITQPGSTGNQTYNLAADFDPKVLFLWGTPQTANGSAANANFSFGWATYRGAAVQQYYDCIRANDSVDPSTARGWGEGAICKLFSAVTPTVDLEIDFVSFATGASSNFILNWVNLHTTASVRVHYMVLGGDEIEDAISGTFTTSTDGSDQDISLPAGFGHPNVVFFKSESNTTHDDAAESLHYMLGCALSDTVSRASVYVVETATSDVEMGAWQTDRAILHVGREDQVADGQGELDPVAGWPTDGFRVQWPTPHSFDAFEIEHGFLAIKGTFNATLGSTTAPTGGDLPVVSNLDHGSPPSGALLWGMNLPASASVDTTHADLGMFGVGALDGTNEAFAGWGNDDAAAADQADCFQTTAKAWQNYSPNATLTSECDGSISENNVQLSWNDIDTVAREVNYLLLGSSEEPEEPAAGPKLRIVQSNLRW